MCGKISVIHFIWHCLLKMHVFLYKTERLELFSQSSVSLYRITTSLLLL